jgi:hypothetical protein
MERWFESNNKVRQMIDHYLPKMVWSSKY